MESTEKRVTRSKIILELVALMIILIGSLALLHRIFATDTNAIFNVENYVEDFPVMYVGESIQLNLQENAVATSDNLSVARVSSSGKLKAVGYGKATIEITSDESSPESFTLLVKDKYEGKSVISQKENFPARQGANGFYVYNSNNGDIENDLVTGLTSLGLMSEEYYAGNGWWNGTSFIGCDHFGGSGAGALSFKATYPGNYTVDYSAWLLESIRKETSNGGYAAWDDVDGFTTGIAKRDTEGKYTILITNIGTRESVISDKTRYQTGSVTVDLKADEEIMMFFCSNGNGNADEVYTEFFVKTNEITGTPLYILPEAVDRFDGEVKINAGESLKLTLRENVTVESEDESVAEIDATGKITGKNFGMTKIVVKDTEEEKSFMLYVDRKRTENGISLSDNLPAKQGENNLYIYYATSGNYSDGINNLEMLPDSDSYVSFWGPTNMYVNDERVFVNGTGAVSFKAPFDGDYIVDYYAYLKAELRNNPLYLTEWDDVDGFTTGLAKKDASGVVTALVTNVGTRQSVVDVATSHQVGTVTLELKKDEEVMFFFSSNITSSADEIMAGFYVSSDSSSVFDGTVFFPNDVLTINDAALLYSGDKVVLQTDFDGKLDYTSSNENVATVENGTVIAKGVGTAVITVGDEFKSKNLVIVVRTRPNTKDIIVSNDVPSTQGEKNLRVYGGPNGDIENDLANGLKDVPEMSANSYFLSENSWWDGSTFINSSHVFSKGVGILGYTISDAGNYRLDYVSCLMPDIYNNKDYPSFENCDGFSVGLMCKKSSGEIEILASDVNTRLSLVEDSTRMLVKEVVYNADIGDELCFFWVSNGSGDCDEIYYKFSIQHVYASDDERPTEITFADKNVGIDVGMQKKLNFNVKYDHGEQYVWSVSNPEVLEVSDGKITGKRAGNSIVTLKVGNVEEYVVVYVIEHLNYVIGSDTDISFNVDTRSEDKPVYMVRMNGVVLSEHSYSVHDGKVIFSKDYLETLDSGSKLIEFFFEGGKISAYLEVCYIMS